MADRTDPRWKQLVKHRPNLTYCIVLNTDLWDHLRAKSLVTEEVQADIIKMDNTPKRQVGLLLDHLVKGPANSYDLFCDCLHATGQSHIVQDYFQPNGEHEQTVGADPGLGKQLYAASELGNEDMVQQLLERGANPNVYQHAEKYNFTALHIAARNGHLAVVELLVEGKADLKSRCTLGRTPFYLTAEGGHVEVLRWLFEAGSEPEPRTTLACTPLYSACDEGNYDCVDELLKRGLDPNAARNTGHIPLHVACEKGHVKIVKRLLEGGLKGKADMMYTAPDGNTPLHLAMAWDRVNVVKFILEENAGRECLKQYGVGGHIGPMVEKYLRNAGIFA